VALEGIGFGNWRMLIKVGGIVFGETAKGLELQAGEIVEIVLH
jgi:hypothetical protein